MSLDTFTYVTRTVDRAGRRHLAIAVFINTFAAWTVDRAYIFARAVIQGARMTGWQGGSEAPCRWDHAPPNVPATHVSDGSFGPIADDAGSFAAYSGFPAVTSTDRRSELMVTLKSLWGLEPLMGTHPVHGGCASLDELCKKRRRPPVESAKHHPTFYLGPTLQ